MSTRAKPMQFVVRVAIGLLVILAAQGVVAGDGIARAKRVFDDCEGRLQRMEKAGGTDLVGPQIEETRGLLREGRKALRHRDVNLALAVAEKLERQMALLETLNDLARLKQRVAQTREEMGEIEKRLSVLRIQYQERLLAAKGSELTDAYPRGEESHE